MPSLKSLKRRLNSVNATLQLSFAMKTVSSVKYSRINKMLSEYEKFSAAEEEIFTPIFNNENNKSETSKKVYILISGNRGLCGGYNNELFSFFDKTIKENNNIPIITCGKKAKEHCYLKDITTIMHFDLPDIPTMDNVFAINEYLNQIEADGLEVLFVRQRHINLLKQEPSITSIFINKDIGLKDNFDNIIFLPDKKTVCESVLPFYLNSTVYSVLLNSAAGVQAATLTAMRSAYDTASESADNLLTKINRKRQSDVTAGVLETRFEETEALYE